MPASDAPLLAQADVRQLERLGISSLDALTAGLVGQREGPGRSAGGVEFGEYRRYAPGDDLRRIDWHAYGRLRELLVNTTPAQARLWVSILLDASASMGSADSAKERYGRRLAALLGTVALLRADAVRLQVLSDGRAVSGGWLDAAGMLELLAEEAARLPAGRETRLAASIAQARSDADRTGIAVLISDCLVPPEEFSAALAQLNRCARSAVVLQVLDPAEAAPGELGTLELRDAETGRVLITEMTDSARRRYEERYRAFRREVERRCLAAGVHLIPAPVDVDALDLLADIARTGMLIQRGWAA